MAHTLSFEVLRIMCPMLDYNTRVALNQCLPFELRYVKRLTKQACISHAVRILEDEIVHRWRTIGANALYWPTDACCTACAGIVKVLVMPCNLTLLQLGNGRLRAIAEELVEIAVRWSHRDPVNGNRTRKQAAVILEVLERPHQNVHEPKVIRIV